MSPETKKEGFKEFDHFSLWIEKGIICSVCEIDMIITLDMAKQMITERLKLGTRINPITKKEIFHNGIGLPVPVGTNIKSLMSGIVESIYFNDAGGNQVIIKHDNGYRTGYSHLFKALVRKGDKVKKGNLIALSGNTGKSTGPHLHFTLTNPLGTKVDPAR